MILILKDKSLPYQIAQKNADVLFRRVIVDSTIRKNYGIKTKTMVKYFNTEKELEKNLKKVKKIF
jgi:hypothetical protein